VAGGYEIVSAPDGTAGIAMATAERPDLILMDLNLPEIDGWEATRRLKAAPATRDIPIIALTAHAMAGDREKALAIGCDEFETKPIDFDRLLPKIERLIDAREGRPAA
jgi:CheY-like chemotaxis protein